MKRACTFFLAVVGALAYLPAGAFSKDALAQFPARIISESTNGQSGQSQAAVERLGDFFHEHTHEIVSEALRLIDNNEREGASLDQRWYAHRRFGKKLQPILESVEVRFYGGRETDILRAISSQYISIAPAEPDQEPGEIRFFLAQRDTGGSDFIIVGQNGKEVALKTVIRLIYLFKFSDPGVTKSVAGGMDAFLRRIRVYFSAVPIRQEFISFLEQHQISDPDAVIVGFQGDARAVLAKAGFSEPERYSSDSLRVNWYPNVHGKKILLVSVNGNRIFASRAGELIQAMLRAFTSPPRTLVFFGSAGAIDSAKLLGRVVAPTVVMTDDYSQVDGRKGKLAHIVNNRASAIVPVKSAHVSVESIVVETTKWAAAYGGRRITTVDQELFHVINALHTSPYTSKIQVFVGMFVTDNVAGTLAHHEATLEHAEDVIGRTASVRRQFLTDVLTEAGIIHRTNAARESLDTSDAGLRFTCVDDISETGNELHEAICGN